MKKLSDNALGYISALTAMIGFGGTFIAVKLGFESFDPIVMSFGRVVPGAILAVVAMKLMKQPLLPPREAFPAILGVTGGVVIGFPILSSLALMTVPAADAGVMGAATPIITSIIAISIGHKNPRPLFWVAAAVGSAAAAALAYMRGGSELGGGTFWGYILLLAAMLGGSIGHITGNHLARNNFNSFHVLCWAVIISIPIQLPGVVIDLILNPITIMPTAGAISGLLFASLFSIIIGNFMLNFGFHKIGLVRGSQLALVQPIVTMILSIVVLQQPVLPVTWVAAVVILASVAWSQRLK
jgi:drug/metabolite transporter (DMT)-like permease